MLQATFILEFCTNKYKKKLLLLLCILIKLKII